MVGGVPGDHTSVIKALHAALGVVVAVPLRPVRASRHARPHLEPVPHLPLVHCDVVCHLQRMLVV